MTLNVQGSEQEIKLSKRQINSIIKDPVKTAEAVNLVYVSNTEPGIIRQKKGTSFYFIFENKKVTDKATLQRIKSLVIPPAWEEVWICALPNGHLQTTGLDETSAWRMDDCVMFRAKSPS